MSYEIRKERGYVWRVGGFNADAWLNWVWGWSVYLDGKRVAGGFESGNNTRSGRPVFPRKRDAQAWLDRRLSGVRVNYS